MLAAGSSGPVADQVIGTFAVAAEKQALHPDDTLAQRVCLLLGQHLHFVSLVKPEASLSNILRAVTKSACLHMGCCSALEGQGSPCSYVTCVVQVHSRLGRCCRKAGAARSSDWDVYQAAVVACAYSVAFALASRPATAVPLCLAGEIDLESRLWPAEG